MGYLDALLAFTLEVGRASAEVGIPPPAVSVAELRPGVRAETVPGEIRVAEWTLRRAVRERKARPWLRCIARHEVAHRALAHRPRTPEEVAENEAEIPLFLKVIWNERDPRCDARLR